MSNWLVDKLIPSIMRSEVKKSSVPEGLWHKCPSCEAVLYRPELEKTLDVCPKCNHHMRIGARARIDIFLDAEGRAELGADLEPVDRLKFRDGKKYKDRLTAAQKQTGEKDALISMSGTLLGMPVVVSAFEFSFMGGSMGAIVGERFVRAANYALEKRCPMICFSASGGARMQEALISLMQMAKTSAVLARLREEGIPFISVLTDPVYGGVSASLAMLGDVIVGEPKALIGFAGPRVIEQTVREKLPEGFQRSEFLLEHGAIDMIIHRQELRPRLGNLLAQHDGPADAEIRRRANRADRGSAGTCQRADPTYPWRVARLPRAVAPFGHRHGPGALAAGSVPHGTGQAGASGDYGHRHQRQGFHLCVRGFIAAGAGPERGCLQLSAPAALQRAGAGQSASKPLDAELCEAFAAVEAGVATRPDLLRNGHPGGVLAVSTLRARCRGAGSRLGGRLDTVNVVDADMALVTSIGVDHADYLGDTRESVAFEKAGIFRQGAPALCGDLNPPQPLLDKARELNCPFFLRGRDFDLGVTDHNWQWRGHDASRACGRAARSAVASICRWKTPRWRCRPICCSVCLGWMRRLSGALQATRVVGSTRSPAVRLAGQAPESAAGCGA